MNGTRRICAAVSDTRIGTRGWRGYCTALMAPLQRKSVEPMASHTAPTATRSRHQSLHHVVAHSSWSDEEMQLRVAQWLVPAMDFGDGGWWILHDTGFPKQRTHSVDVARQYRGMLSNCHAAQGGSLPVAWRLYLPKEWCEDEAMRQKRVRTQAGEFAAKPAIALAQLERLLVKGAPRHCVLADAGNGTETAFRERLAAPP